MSDGACVQGHSRMPRKVFEYDHWIRACLIWLGSFVTHRFEQCDSQERVDVIRCDFGGETMCKAIPNRVEPTDSWG